MQSIGLALTLSLLTGTFVALDLASTQAASMPPTAAQTVRNISIETGVEALSVMPNSLPGLAVPKADINNGVFSIGSSTGKEGLEDDDYDDQDGGAQDSDVDEDTSPANADVDSDNDFVLI